MKTRSRIVAPGIAGVFCGLALSGCGAGDREALPDWSAGFEGPITPGGDDPDPPPSGGAMELSVPEDTGLNMRINNGESRCALSPSGSIGGDEVVSCTIDITEEDLIFGGLQFDLSIPSGVCDHVQWSHYMYLAWSMGQPEPIDTDLLTVVSYTKNVDTGAISAEVNSIEGKPVCAFDHTAKGGPNCCLGKYKVVVTEVDESGATLGETTSPPQDWGGKAGNCYSGAAYLDPEAELTITGFPKTGYAIIDKQAYYKGFRFDPGADVANHNVNYANYFNPDDHTDGAPPGLGAVAQQHKPLGVDINVYEFFCDDSAAEWYGRIRLTVREWNLEAEYEDFDDPDTTGELPNGDPIDDYYDWLGLQQNGFLFPTDGI